MNRIKYVTDRVAVVTVAVWSAVSPLLVEQHVIGTHLALDIGVAVTAALGAYHGGAVVAGKSSDPGVPPLNIR